MTGPVNSPYERRFTDPQSWPSNAFGHYAAGVTGRRINDLSWELAGHQVADEAARFLGEVGQVSAAEQARQERQRIARAEGWRRGEPGE